MSHAYQRLLIFYFSGTGNARQTARWIADEASKEGIETQVQNIDKIQHVDLPDSQEKLLIGFCGPTHGFNFPPVMLKFLWNFPKRKNTDAFIVNTRAGMKLSKLFLPGLGGLAQYYAAAVLIIKGYTIVGMQPMDLPSNWISLHPGLRDKVVESMFKRCEKITRKFARKMFAGERKYKALWSLPFDLVVAPIAVAYYFIGRFAIAKTFVATSTCTNCGLCEKHCPVGAIKNISSRPYWTFNCESCMRCMNNCPERAIQTSHTISIGLWWVFLGLLSPWLVSVFTGTGASGFLRLDALPVMLQDILLWIIGLALIWLGYRLTHILMRFKLFNMLVAYTSLTRYGFWRRYRAPKNLMR